MEPLGLEPWVLPLEFAHEFDGDGNRSNNHAETDGLFEGVPCVSQHLACCPNCTNGKIQVGGSGSDPGVSIFLTGGAKLRSEFPNQMMVSF